MNDIGFVMTFVFPARQLGEESDNIEATLVSISCVGEDNGRHCRPEVHLDGEMRKWEMPCLLLFENNQHIAW